MCVCIYPVLAVFLPLGNLPMGYCRWLRPVVRLSVRQQVEDNLQIWRYRLIWRIQFDDIAKIDDIPDVSRSPIRVDISSNKVVVLYDRRKCINQINHNLLGIRNMVFVKVGFSKEDRFRQNWRYRQDEYVNYQKVNIIVYIYIVKFGEFVKLGDVVKIGDEPRPV